MQTTAPTINTYLSDMLALEQHIGQPIKKQSESSELQKSPTAMRVVLAAGATIDAHVLALERRLEAVGGHAGSPVKSGIASALGVVASAIGSVRKSELSKELRDDYTALCLASAAYTMLHTTALGLRDSETAALAKNHLADVADLVMRFSSALPVVVLQELTEEGVTVDQTVVQTAEKNLEDAWRAGGERSGTH